MTTGNGREFDLRAFRKALGMSAGGFARVVDRSESWVHKVESGRLRAAPTVIDRVEAGVARVCAAARAGEDQASS